VRDTLWAALLLYLARLAGIWLGCYGGAALGGTPEGIGDRVWMGMVTQVTPSTSLSAALAKLHLCQAVPRLECGFRFFLCSCLTKGTRASLSILPPAELVTRGVAGHMQAGVALGLARIVSGTFPSWGPDFSALAAGVVLMNLFTGPPLFKVRRCYSVWRFLCSY
jgi:hypothetical protein